MDIYLKYYNSLIFIKFVIKYFIQKANVILVSIIFELQFNNWHYRNLRNACIIH